MLKHTLLAALLTTLALPALADAPGGEVRQQAFKKILRVSEPMGKVVRGADPYNKDAFIKMADSLKLIAGEPFKLFEPKNIDDKSRAKPEIWSKPAEFKAATDKFLVAVNDLDAAARTGDMNAIKARYDAVSQSCKTCHDSFRGPQR